MPTALVIDDDIEMRAIVRAALPEWQVIEAADGAAGVAHLDDHGPRPDLVILDILMAQLDGYDTCSLIRARAPEVPILPFTAASEAVGFLAEMGCAPALLKPVARQELRAAAYRAVRAQVAPPQPGTAVLDILQRKAAERHHATCAQQRVYGLLAANPAVRAGLRTQVRQAGLTLAWDVASVSVLRRLPDARAVACLLLAAEEWDAVQAFVAERPLPLLVIATTRSAGWAVAHLSGRAAVGVVPLDAGFPQMVSDALAAVLAGRRFVAPALESPFAGAGLRPHEQAVVALLQFGRTADEIATVLHVTERTAMQYQTRICQHLQVSGARGIRGWAQAWEQEHALALPPLTTDDGRWTTDHRPPTTDD